MTQPRRPRLRRLATVLAGLAVGAAGTLLGAGTAAAASVTVTYDVTGTTHVAKTDSDMSLGPGGLVSTLDLSTAVLSSDLSLPSSTAEFKALGLLPTRATVDFLPQGPAIGAVSATQITATAKVTIRVHDVWSGGLPVLVGNDCKTSVPATISLVSAPGFTVLGGGDLTGTYTIPDLSNCTLFSGLLNALIAGPNNTITLHLTLHQ